MVFERGQIFESDSDNIFIKYVGETVKFIEGFSPSAIHDMQELSAEDLEAYINEYGYVRASEDLETFLNA